MINEVLCTELLLHIFKKLKYVYKPCCMLTCRRWKEIFDAYDPNKTYRMELHDVQEFLPDMTFPCGMFLLRLVTGCKKPINMTLCICCEKAVLYCNKRRRRENQVIQFKDVSF